MRVLIRLLLMASASLGVAACGSASVPSEPPATSDAELEWVRRYSAWTENFLLVWERSGPVRASVLAGRRPRSDLRSAYARIRDCAGTLEAEVGAPPTPRLVRAQTLTRRACSALGVAVSIELGGLGGDPGAVAPEAETEWARASQLLLQASQQLQELLGDARPLPVRAAPQRASHIEPLFGRAAGEITHDHVEARCWSRSDWDQVSAVQAALDPGDYVDFAGLASPDERRISLAPAVCTWLAELAYTRVPPQQPEQVVELADAVLTLAHEAVHVRAPSATEAETECYALQEIRRAARALGATAAYADRLARVVWTEIYPLNDEVYSTPACRSGGPLDMDPARRAWP